MCLRTMASKFKLLNLLFISRGLVCPDWLLELVKKAADLTAAADDEKRHMVYGKIIRMLKVL